jgi:IS5 family transposase
MPFDSSSLTHWRKKLGSKGCQKLLQESVEIGLRTNTVRKASLKKVVFDTTVQVKNITYPTDSKLYYKCIQHVVKCAKEYSIKLKQTFKRAAKQALILAGRYAHQRHMKKARKEIKKLKTFAGRILRDFKRKCPVNFLKEKELAKKLEIMEKILKQQRNDQNKIYSLHEPHAECISKGKVHKKYEFGCKVSLACTAKEGFILETHACHGRPYDGHTLAKALRKVERNTQINITKALVDKGYRGHGLKKEGLSILISGAKKQLSKSDKKLLNRRQVIEPIIGHSKSEGHLKLNRLKGRLGDAVNSILSSVGQNLRMVLNAIENALAYT